MKIILLILVSIIAFTSTVSGLLMIIDPKGGLLNLPLSLLESSPFKSYLFPGILLTGLVGGINMTALYNIITYSTTRYNWATAGGIIITGWIIAQMNMIHSLHWLHFIYFGAGVFIILIAYQLKGKWAA